METKKIVAQFRNTIITYALPYDEIVIAPYTNGRVSGVTLFNGIEVADYITCEDQSAKLTSKQVAKELHVKYRTGLGF